MASAIVIRDQVWAKDSNGVLRKPETMAPRADRSQFTIVSYTTGFPQSTVPLAGGGEMIQLEMKTSGEQTGPWEDVTIRFKVTVGGSAIQLLPSPYWFQRIELWNGNKERMFVMYP